MRFPKARAARLALVSATAFVVSGAMASAALAGSYTAVVTPGSVAAGTTNGFTVTLTNTSAGDQLNTAVIRAPRDFTLDSASLGSPTGTLQLTPSVVSLSGLQLSPNGGTDTISVTATAACPSDTYYWNTAAFSNGSDGQELDLNRTASSLTTDVTGSCGLEFATEPNNALVNTRITGNSYDTSGPPVTVQVLDANGVPTVSDAAVAVALGTDTSADNAGADLDGHGTRWTRDGVATFKQLRLNRSNNDYTLVASGSDVTSAESSPFDIGDGETACNTSMDCTLTLTGSASTLNINAGPNSGQLTGQVDPGTPMDGPGSNPDADPGCANYTPQNPDWYGFDVINQGGESTPPAKTLTWTVQDATPVGFMVCFGSTSPFVTVNSDGGIQRAPAGTLPDGTEGFVGFLPFCNQLTDFEGREPCITDDPLQTQPDRKSTTGEDVIVDVSIPAGFPGDPFIGRG